MTPSLDNIRTFLAVADAGSFTKAAERLGVSLAAVSKAIRSLEKSNRIALFQRNTRNVALTEAGRALRADLLPATEQIEEAFARLHLARDQPVGTLRLTVPRALGAPVLDQLVPAYRLAYPDVTLELSMDDQIVDIVKGGFDAGVRLGHQVEPGMVAVPLTLNLEWCVVGSPAYLDRAGRPAVPDELMLHQTLRYRFHGSGALHRWHFKKRDDVVDIDPPTRLVVNDTRLIARFACAGLGLAYLPALEIEGELAAGQLERVLQEWVPASPGLYLYFPTRTQNQRKLRAFIDLAKETGSAADR